MRYLRLLPFGFGWFVLFCVCNCACNQASTPHASAHTPGSVLRNPGQPYAPVFVEENAGGRAPELRLVRASYGRLVDVYGWNADGLKLLVLREVVVRAGLVSDLTNYQLSTDRVTGQQNLLIPRDVTQTTGWVAFQELLRAATEGLDPLFDTGFNQSGFYSMVPRNATVVLQFNDLLDPELVHSENLQTLVGPAPFSSFESRVLPDPLYGDLLDWNDDGREELYSTRALVDFTTNSFESFLVSPPLPVQALGLPSASDQNRDNVQIRIPTQLAPIYGQTTLLRNLSGHTLEFLANGSADSASPMREVVRAFRSGGKTAVTGDAYNGFLRDEQRPNVLGAFPALVATAPLQVPNERPEVFRLPNLRFSSPECAQRPQVDDVLLQTQAQGVLWARVIEEPANDPDEFGNVPQLLVEVFEYPAAWDETLGVAQWSLEGAGAVQFLSAYDPVADVGRERCFLETFPLALGFPNNPASGISSTATWGLRFNEAMDPETFSAYDGLRLTRVDPATQPLSPSDYAITEISSSADRTRFVLTPHFPLNHASGQTESLFLSVTQSGRFAPTDLAGNVLEFAFPTIEGTLSATSIPIQTGGHVSLFSAADEEAPIANQSVDPFAFCEWGGQHTYAVDRGVIVPRPVARFTQVVERSNPFMGSKAQWPGGVEEPLARLGSFTQMLWRIYDLNMDLFHFDLTDPNNLSEIWRLDSNKLNIDVERVYWSPLTGGISFDAFAGFAMRISHGLFLPDEVHAGTGLAATFLGNQLSPTLDAPTEVHFREQGYTLHPGDRIQTSLPTVLMPFPMNSDPKAPKRYSTFRDTALLVRAGPSGIGANIAAFANLAGIPAVFDSCDGLGTPKTFYNAGQVQSAGLPLLIEFRCYPDSAATTANRLDVSMGLTNTTHLAPPWFRAFSTGGINVEQDEQFVDPDAAVVASGGFDPLSAPIPGAPTPGLDNLIYVGGVDFVIRISRSFSVWYPTPDSNGTALNSPEFFSPVVEPKAQDQPPGTSVRLDFRGATAIAGAYQPGSPIGDPNESGFRMTAVAQLSDPYGDQYADIPLCAEAGEEPYLPLRPVCHDADYANRAAKGLVAEGNWVDQASAINGAQFFQLRATFTANAETGLTPVLSTVAIGWKE